MSGRVAANYRYTSVEMMTFVEIRYVAIMIDVGMADQQRIYRPCLIIGTTNRPLKDIAYRITQFMAYVPCVD